MEFASAKLQNDESFLYLPSQAFSPCIDSITCKLVFSHTISGPSTTFITLSMLPVHNIMHNIAIKTFLFSFPPVRIYSASAMALLLYSISSIMSILARCVLASIKVSYIQYLLLDYFGAETPLNLRCCPLWHILFCPCTRTYNFPYRLHTRCLEKLIHAADRAPALPAYP